LTHLPIRLLPVPGVEVTDETVKLPPYISAALRFALARFETLELTATATQPSSALLRFAPHLRYAKRYSFRHCPEPGYRNKCIRRCAKSPLKNRL